ncbi:MAG: hypothetical protein HY897_16210 [Deltaproteobacteria bacterium]|nr:hypothetical protein [Deltaproteobacteria bacterium]
MSTRMAITLIALVFTALPASVLAQTKAPAKAPSKAPAKATTTSTPAPAQPPAPSAQPSWPEVKPDAKKNVLSIAFFQLEAQGVDARVAGIVSDTMLTELGKLPDSKVIGSKDIDAMLGYEQKKQLTGCTDTSCVVAVGGALGVDKLVMGSLGKIGDSHVMNVKALDIRNGTVDAMFNKRLKGGSEEDFLDVIPEALTVLFPWGEGIWKKAPPKSAAASAPMINRDDAIFWGHVSMWSGLGVAAFGGVSMILAKSAADDYASGKGGSDAKDKNGLWSTMAITGLSVGVAAMATGATLWILAPDEPVVKKKVSVGAVPVEGGFAVGAHGVW